MGTITAFYFAASLFFALISIPMAISADDFRKDMGALVLALMSALFLFGGLRGL